MKNKLFVLFVVLVLVISLGLLFKYDKKELEKQKANEQINEQLEEIENNEETFDEFESENAKVKEIEEKNKIDKDNLGKLRIEKINLEGTIKEGTSTEILRDYIGHIEESDIYNGNVGLAAHNRGNQYSYFARINELEVGDKIIYESVYGTKIYKVKDKKEILETDWSMLGKTKDNRLTLITCIRNKINKRLCVQAIEEV